MSQSPQSRKPRKQSSAELLSVTTERTLFKPAVSPTPMKRLDYLTIGSPTAPDPERRALAYGLSTEVLRPTFVAGSLERVALSDPLEATDQADFAATPVSDDEFVPLPGSVEAGWAREATEGAYHRMDAESGFGVGRAAWSPAVAPRPEIAANGAAAALIAMGAAGSFPVSQMLAQMSAGAAANPGRGAEIGAYLQALSTGIQALEINKLADMTDLSQLDPSLGGLVGGLGGILGQLGGPGMQDLAATLGQVAEGLNALGLKASDLGSLTEVGDLFGPEGFAAMGDAASLEDLAMGHLPDLAGFLAGKLLAQLPPEVQTAIAVGQQLLQVLGLPSSLKDMIAGAMANAPTPPPPPPPVVPGVWVEGHHIATVGLAFASHDGLPLAPGPGAANVLSQSKPVWRVGKDLHACKVPAPGHGPGKVAKGAVKTYADKAPIARFGDLLVGEAAPNMIIDAVTAAQRRAALELKDESAGLTAPPLGNGGAGGQGAGTGASGGGESSATTGSAAAAPGKEYPGVLNEGFDDPNAPMDGGRYLIDSNGELLVDPNLKVGDVLDPNLPEHDRAMVYINGMDNRDLNAPDGPLAQARELARISGRPVVVVFNQAPGSGWTDFKSAAENYREHLGLELPYIDLYQHTPEASQAALAQLMSATNGKIDVVAHSEGSLLASLAAGSSGKSGMKITTIGGPAVLFPGGVVVVRNGDNLDPVAYLSFSSDDQDVDTPYRDPHSALSYFGTNTVRFAGETDEQYERRLNRLGVILPSQRTQPRPAPQPGPTPTPNSSTRPTSPQTPAERPNPRPGPTANSASSGKNSGTSGQGSGRPTPVVTPVPTPEPKSKGNQK